MRPFCPRCHEHIAACECAHTTSECNCSLRTQTEAIEIYDALRSIGLWNKFYEYWLDREEDNMELVIEDFLDKEEVMEHILNS